MKKTLGTVHYGEIINRLKCKNWNEKVVRRMHITDNPKSWEDVEKAKEGYVNFLQQHYPQLKSLSKEEIYSLTRGELYWDLLHPERKRELNEMIYQNKQLCALENINDTIKNSMFPNCLFFWKNKT